MPGGAGRQGFSLLRCPCLLKRVNQVSDGVRVVEGRSRRQVRGPAVGEGTTPASSLTALIKLAMPSVWLAGACTADHWAGRWSPGQRDS